jgi:outer membrane protein TolC
MRSPAFSSWFSCGLGLAGLFFALPTQAQDDAAAASDAPPSDVRPIDVEAFLRGEGRGWTADEAAARAVQSAPSLDAQRAMLAQARAGAARALQAFVPRVELNARYSHLSPISQPTLFGGGSSGISPTLEAHLRERIAAVEDPAARELFLVNLEAQLAQQRAFSSFMFPVILDQWSLGSSLTVPVTDVFLQIWPAYEAAVGVVEAQRLQVRARASEVAQQAREAFYAYARARGALAVARAAVETADMQERMVAAMVQAGTAAPVDLLRVQAQVASARVARGRAEAGVRIAETALRTILHLGDDEPIAIAEDLLGPLPEVGESREALLAIALRQRVEVRALRQLIAARSRQIDAAEGSRWPHLVLAGNLTYANPNPRIFPQRQEFRETWDVSMILSWSPNDFFQGERQADEARALRAQAEADLRSLEDGVRMQVTQAYENLRAALAAVEAARAGVRAAEETLRVRTAQYRAGATVITELVLAVNERARAQLDLVGTAIDARIAHTQLRRAIGADGPYEGIE